MRTQAEWKVLTHMALTKLDVLSGLPTVRICVGYEGHEGLPDDMAEATPIYEDLPGWSEDLTGCRSFEELPANCQAYVRRVEQLVGVEAGLISVGPGRSQTILRDPLFRD